MAERPTSQGYFLGEQLKRLRHGSGMSLAAVAALLGCSEAKVSRIEGGRSKVRVTDMVRLLDIYGITDDGQRSYLINFTHQQEIRVTGWWRERADHHGGNVPQYLALEAVASRMRNIEPAMVPGLLQTPSYARVVLRARREGAVLDRETDARLARRRRLLDGELEATFLVGETALTLIPPDVRREQLGRLLEMAELPNVSIKLIPVSEIAYLTHGNPLVLLSFADEGLSDVAYVEHWAGSFVIDDPGDVTACANRYELVEKSCSTGYDTVEWMKNLCLS